MTIVWSQTPASNAIQSPRDNAAQLPATAPAAIAPAATPTTSMNGNYIYRGMSCQNPEDLTTVARKINEAYREHEKQEMLRINDDRWTFKTLNYKFEGYRPDHCEVITETAVTLENQKVTGKLLSSQASVSGEYHPQVCDLYKTMKPHFAYAYAFRNDFLYLLKGEERNAKTFCKDGPVYSVYVRTAEFEFVKTERPIASKKDDEFREALKKAPQNAPSIVAYTQYLIGEGRISEAKAYLEILKKADPQNSRIVSFAFSIRRVEAQKNPIDQGKMIALVTAQMKKTYDPPEVNVNEMNGNEAGENNQRGIASSSSNDHTSILNEFPVEKLKSKQYVPSMEEQSVLQSALESKEKDRSAAREKMEALYKAHPKSPYILEQYGLFLFEEGAFDAAIELIEKNEHPEHLHFLVLKRAAGEMKINPDAAKRKDILARAKKDLIILAELLQKEKPTKQPASVDAPPSK